MFSGFGLAVGLIGVGTLVSCESPGSTPQEVRVQNPSITYNYRTDSDLLHASQNAAAYCAKYQSFARTERITDNPDGSKTVVFDCAKTNGPATSATAPVAGPKMTYSFSSDRDLLDASRSAQNLCMKNGSVALTSDIATNADGSKTITFQCSPPGHS
jgi:hypothetical protein